MVCLARLDHSYLVRNQRSEISAVLSYRLNKTNIAPAVMTIAATIL